nr:MAG TPA: hypothetical protein [Caudoviricetes sp.]
MYESTRKIIYIILVKSLGQRFGCCFVVLIAHNYQCFL